MERGSRTVTVRSAGLWITSAGAAFLLLEAASGRRRVAALWTRRASRPADLKAGQKTGGPGHVLLRRDSEARSARSGTRRGMELVRRTRRKKPSLTSCRRARDGMQRREKVSGADIRRPPPGGRAGVVFHGRLGGRSRAGVARSRTIRDFHGVPKRLLRQTHTPMCVFRHIRALPDGWTSCHERDPLLR